MANKQKTIAIGYARVLLAQSIHRAETEYQIATQAHPRFMSPMEIRSQDTVETGEKNMVVAL
jgi:hypothetical protein